MRRHCYQLHSFGPDKLGDLFHRIAYLHLTANSNTPKLVIPERCQLRSGFSHDIPWRWKQFKTGWIRRWNGSRGTQDVQQRDFGAVPLRNKLRVTQHAPRLVGKIDGNKDM
jgi:hypothetical protein